MVGFPAGGATDTTARLIAQRMQAALGQTIVVENIGGAGGSIAAKQVATAPPDGYTLMMTTTSAFGTMPRLYKLDYDPVKAFVPVATLVVDKSVLVVGPSWPVKTVQELVAQAKAAPGKFNYGSAIGIGPHFVFELFKRKAGVDIVHVPYRGGGPMIADLIGGQIHATINGKSVLRQHIATGKVRALGVTAAKRWDDMKDVPTLMEAGFLDAPYDTLFGHRRAGGRAGGDRRAAQRRDQRGPALGRDARRPGEARHRALRHDAGGIRQARRRGGAALGRGGGADRHQGAVRRLRASRAALILRSRA